MPIVVRGRGSRGKSGEQREPSPHGVLWGALGSLLRLLGIAVLAILLDVPGFVAANLHQLALLTARSGVAALEESITGSLIDVLASIPVYIIYALLGLLGITAWFIGGKFIERGWKRLTSRWSKRARRALLVFNIIGTLLWLLGIFALIYPFVSTYIANMLGGSASYIDAIVQTARNVNIALIAFTLSALTPAVAGLIHATQAWGRGGKLAALFFVIGGLVYAANVLVVYLAWRAFAAKTLHLLPSNPAAITPRQLAAILDGLAGIAAMFTMYLRIAMITYALWLIGFLAAWWDYWRASRGR